MSETTAAKIGILMTTKSDCWQPERRLKSKTQKLNENGSRLVEGH